MMQAIELDGKTVLGFDSGLDSRSFAQAKLAQLIAEPGFVVCGTDVGLWKASGVAEIANAEKKPTMVIWGPSFEGERLDLLLEKSGEQDKMLTAIVRWIKAFLLVKEKYPQYVPPLWPCAAIIGETSIFFAPPNLIGTCMAAAETEARFSGSYVHPAFNGMDAAAFTFAAMLYHVLAGIPPFTAQDEALLHQDMREGNFLPIRFAVPGLDARLSSLIQNALIPLEKRTGGSIRGITLLNGILAIVQADGQSVCAASLAGSLSDDGRLQLEKEKTQFVKRKTALRKVKHFIDRNKTPLIAGFAAVLIALIVGTSVAKNRSSLPAGLSPAEVIGRYYNAIGELDHQTMESCVIRNAGKTDISMVINLFVISKMRQVYGANNSPALISASLWQQGENEPFDSRAFEVFGVTDLNIKQMADSGGNSISYQANYTLWVPAELAAEVTPEAAALVEAGQPFPFHRSDLITIVKKKKGWRISEIKRE
ncbi:MAG: hypothetical protein LBG95_07620 [Treponema sp.]|jgi:hypothetical protein|nr:hypothetical protein [Treponema sp.]